VGKITSGRGPTVLDIKISIYRKEEGRADAQMLAREAPCSSRPQKGEAGLGGSERVERGRSPSLTDMGGKRLLQRKSLGKRLKDHWKKR